MGMMAVEVPQGSILETWGTMDGTGSQPVIHQGLIVGAGCAPCGNGLICVRTAFFMRAAHLITMLGLY